MIHMMSVMYVMDVMNMMVYDKEHDEEWDEKCDEYAVAIGMDRYE